MDAPRRLTDSEADRKLRDLFAQAGSLHAPDDLELRVLFHLKAEAAALSTEERPLIANWVWLTLGSLLMVLMLFSLWTPVSAGTSESLFQRYLPERTIPDLSMVLRSTWTLMALICAAAFLSLEAFLFRPQAVRSGR